VRKPKDNREFRKTWSIQVTNIVLKGYLKDWAWGCGLLSSKSDYYQVSGPCKYNNKLSVSIKG